MKGELIDRIEFEEYYTYIYFKNGIKLTIAPTYDNLYYGIGNDEDNIEIHYEAIEKAIRGNQCLNT